MISATFDKSRVGDGLIGIELNSPLPEYRVKVYIACADVYYKYTIHPDNDNRWYPLSVGNITYIN